MSGIKAGRGHHRNWPPLGCWEVDTSHRGRTRRGPRDGMAVVNVRTPEGCGRCDLFTLLSPLVVKGSDSQEE